MVLIPLCALSGSCRSLRSTSSTSSFRTPPCNCNVFHSINWLPWLSSCLFLAQSFLVSWPFHNCDSLHIHQQALRLNFHFALSPYFHIFSHFALLCAVDSCSQTHSISQFSLWTILHYLLDFLCTFLKFIQFEFFSIQFSGRFIWIRFDQTFIPWRRGRGLKTDLSWWHSTWSLKLNGAITSSVDTAAAYTPLPFGIEPLRRCNHSAGDSKSLEILP